MRPLVLCTNDDGIDSPHLGALVAGLQACAAAPEVLVVAPERQRSAASHAITLHKPLRLTEVRPRWFSLSGTPADCVYVGILKLAGRRPDLVVSGLNDGFNLGSDVFYSGTVAGAVEGALRGTVGIACSVAPRIEDAALARAVAFVASVAAGALAAPLAPGSVLNLNMPREASDRYQWTTLGRRRYEDDVAERADPRGRPYYWVGGGPAGHDEIAGSDCVAVAEGLNSVTPLHLDLTHRGAVEAPPWPVAGFERA